jgi:hypothetical protein
MTKIITIPISKETCVIIKKAIGWFLWIGFTTLAIYGLVIALFDIGFDSSSSNAGLLARKVVGFISIIVVISQPTLMINYLKSIGKWVEFKCNCKGSNNLTTTDQHIILEKIRVEVVGLIEMDKRDKCWNPRVMKLKEIVGAIK